MAKRDYVAEIASRRGRIRRRTPRYTEMNTRLGGISAIAAFVRESSNKDVPFRSEIAKYIPIGPLARQQLVGPERLYVDSNRRAISRRR